MNPSGLSAPRQKARYSDTGFQLLVASLELVTGRSFADLLHDRIFDPVGMAHSWLPGHSKPVADIPEPALIHGDRHPPELPQLFESSNDLASTAGDLLRFQQVADPTTVNTTAPTGLVAHARVGGSRSEGVRVR